ncbi:MAG: NucA/NucB deoxyribonuclease domain-containing protein [Solirubrobacterales bacterium]|nr:NucA/NucB deoxyribonuclease domain-containing protein [Solirubrobacterales bacterium]
MSPKAIRHTFVASLVISTVAAGVLIPTVTSSTSGFGGPNASAATADTAACRLRPRGVVTLVFSRSKYPRIRAHAIAAIRKGWPSVLVVNRTGASARRTRLLRNIPTKRGYDRDEYPPAVGRGTGYGLQSGSGPTGWRADVKYVPSKENRSHGSSLGGKLRKYCNGTKFRYAFG